MKTIHHEQHGCEGYVLAATVIFLTLLAVITTSLILMATSAQQFATRWGNSDQLFLIAQSALEQEKMNIESNFNAYYVSQGYAWSSFSWFNSSSSSNLGANPVYSAPQGASYSNASYWITINSVSNSGTVSRDVSLTCLAKYTNTGSSNNMVRSIRETVRYQLSTSPIFNYSYFINNFGWFYGSTITSHGDVRANGNFAFQSSPVVNGNVYAAANPALSATGGVSGAHTAWSLSTYDSTAPTAARPGSPPAVGGNPWAQGYTGSSQNYQFATVLPMPYLGNLSIYDAYAATNNGTIKQAGTTVVNNVYSGKGPDGVAGTPDDGCLVLNGTTAHPIVVNGPVVISNDLIISGTITGQGTIYAGRNIHIISNLTYANPPTWPKPDSNPTATANTDATKDLIGLACKGNVILGDYTLSAWQSAVTPYIQPSFTAPYAVDPSDVPLGYGTSGNATIGYTFNGNYNANDGGLQNGNSGGTTSRKFYESSLSDNAFHALANGATITEIDAILYNNHLITGNVGAITFKGGVISHDEAIIFSGSVNFDWDIRVGSQSQGSSSNALVDLPVSLISPQVVRWQELP